MKEKKKEKKENNKSNNKTEVLLLTWHPLLTHLLIHLRMHHLHMHHRHMHPPLCHHPFNNNNCSNRWRTKTKKSTRLYISSTTKMGRPSSWRPPRRRR